MKRLVLLVLCGSLVTWVSGCSAFKASVKPIDADKAQPLDSDYDYIDMRWLGDSSAQEIMGSGFLKGLPSKPTFRLK